MVGYKALFHEDFWSCIKKSKLNLIKTDIRFLVNSETPILRFSRAVEKTRGTGKRTNWFNLTLQFKIETH